MKTFCHCDLPHAHFVGLVVIRIIGGLDLATISHQLPATDGCREVRIMTESVQRHSNAKVKLKVLVMRCGITSTIMY